MFGHDACLDTPTAKRVYEGLRATGTTQDEALERICDRYKVKLERILCLKGTAKQEEIWRSATLSRSSTNRN